MYQIFVADLLEKSRVTYCGAAERNYHIFYQVMTSANAKHHGKFINVVINMAATVCVCFFYNLNDDLNSIPPKYKACLLQDTATHRYLSTLLVSNCRNVPYST